MTKDCYHHGTLKKEMIEKGLQLLNNGGIEGFSLRKVAMMCGVSHAAPYKHFKSKEELIIAIVDEVKVSFMLALEEAVNTYPENIEKQVIEMAKCYVKFMVENPDYLKFLFLSPKNKNIDILHESDRGNNSYYIFEKSAINYLKSINANTEDRDVDILTLWSIIHGFTVLLVNDNLMKLPDNYLEVVEKMILEKLNFRKQADIQK